MTLLSVCYAADCCCRFCLCCYGLAAIVIYEAFENDVKIVNVEMTSEGNANKYSTKTTEPKPKTTALQFEC